MGTDRSGPVRHAKSSLGKFNIAECDKEKRFASKSAKNGWKQKLKVLVMELLVCPLRYTDFRSYLASDSSKFLGSGAKTE
jgi:hypothetical protein